MWILRLWPTCPNLVFGTGHQQTVRVKCIMGMVFLKSYAYFLNMPLPGNHIKETNTLSFVALVMNQHRQHQFRWGHWRYWRPLLSVFPGNLGCGGTFQPNNLSFSCKHSVFRKHEAEADSPLDLHFSSSQRAHTTWALQFTKLWTPAGMENPISFWQVGPTSLWNSFRVLFPIISCL